MIDVLIRSLHDAFGYGIWVYDKDEATGQVRVLESVGEFTWKEHESGGLLPKPIFSTSTREGEIIFEKFIERLKEAGYGRDKVSVESGELKATKDHLADMKKLVFEPPAHLKPYFIAFNEKADGTLIVRRGEESPSKTSDVLMIKKDRVLAAAGNCAQTKIVLKTLFPEAFE